MVVREAVGWRSQFSVRSKFITIIQTVHSKLSSHRRRITTATLNLVVREAVGWRSPPSLRGDPRKGRIYYATQVHPSQSKDTLI